MRTFDFAEALFVLRAGGKVRRESWPANLHHMTIAGKKRREFFAMTCESGEEIEFPINSAMALAADWREA